MSTAELALIVAIRNGFFEDQPSFKNALAVRALNKNISNHAARVSHRKLHLFDKKDEMDRDREHKTPFRAILRTGSVDRLKYILTLEDYRHEAKELSADRRLSRQLNADWQWDKDGDKTPLEKIKFLFETDKLNLTGNKTQALWFLFGAVWQRDLEQMDYLLSLDPPVNDLLHLSEGHTSRVLHVALRKPKGTAVMIKKLLDAKCDPNLVQPCEQKMPTIMSAGGNPPNPETHEMICLLLDYNANVDAQEVGGLTLAHLACGRCFEPLWMKVVDTLIERGANFSVQDCEGMTPMHALASGLAEEDNFDRCMDFANCGKKLARAGADRSITQQDGIMPLQLVVFALQNFNNKFRHRNYVQLGNAVLDAFDPGVVIQPQTNPRVAIQPQIKPIIVDGVRTGVWRRRN